MGNISVLPVGSSIGSCFKSTICPLPGYCLPSFCQTRQFGFRRGGGPEEGNLKGLCSLGFPSSGSYFTGEAHAFKS